MTRPNQEVSKSVTCDRPRRHDRRRDRNGDRDRLVCSCSWHVLVVGTVHAALIPYGRSSSRRISFVSSIGTDLLLIANANQYPTACSITPRLASLVVHAITRHPSPTVVSSRSKQFVYVTSPATHAPAFPSVHTKEAQCHPPSLPVTPKKPDATHAAFPSHQEARCHLPSLPVTPRKPDATHAAFLSHRRSPMPPTQPSCHTKEA